MSAISGLTYGDDRFVAVGDHGMAMVSEDGENWIPTLTPTQAKLNDVAFAHGRFVAVGDSGSVVVSSDGYTWESATSGTTNQLNAVELGDDHFLAVGARGTAILSADGGTWTVSPTNALIFEEGYVEEAFLDLAAGNERYMAIAGSRYLGNVTGQRLMASDDGVTWMEVAFPGSSKPLTIEFGEGRFIVGSEDPDVYSTVDGATWVKEALGPQFGAGVQSYLTDGTKSVAFFGTAGSGYAFRESPTEPWKNFFRSYKADVRSAAYGGGIWVTAGGQLGTSDAGVFRSTNGMDWKQVDSTPHPLVRSLLSLNGMFFGVQLDQRTRIDLVPSNPAFITTSTNGVSWSKHPWPAKSQPVFGTWFKSSYFVAAANGTLWQSTSGTDWAESLPSGDIAALVPSDDLLVALEVNGTVHISSDGQSWTDASIGMDAEVASAAFGSNTFLCSTSSGELWASPDGNQWHQITPTGLDIAGTLYFSAGKFASLGDYNQLHFSETGTNWVSSGIDLDAELKLAVTDDRFVLVANESDIFSGGNATTGHHRVFSSSDGIQWTEHAGAREGFVREMVASGAGVLMSVWPRGMLISEPLIPTAPHVAEWPQSVAVGVGETASLQSAVLGTFPIHLQWQTSGTNIFGATNEFLFVNPEDFGGAATFTLSASNDFGATTSTPAKVVTGTRPILALTNGMPPRLRILGTPDRTYRVEETDHLLKSNTWQTVQSVTIPPGGASDSIVATNGAQFRILRAVLIPE